MASVRFVGSGDAFGSGGRLQTCILVEHREWRCLIDCGATSLVGLKAAEIDPASIDTIVISHLHGDHFGGLPFLLLDAQFNSKRSTTLQIVGHADLEARLRETMDMLYPGSQSAFDSVDVEFVVVGPESAIALGAASVEVVEVVHFAGSPSFGVRVTTPSGAIVAYSGDTEWTDTLVDLADGADLFIVECNFYDQPVTWHMDYATLSANLHRLSAGRVIATHMGPAVLARAADLEIDTAHDGLVIEL